ncbi:C_GCAxxG_C_C family protein [Eubacterium sp. OM08-24]|jgi:C_GCAxxG_C_C family probable redox protein|uniref:C-GCAxxG-C-C family protein n=1 Tax=Eubacterium sp. OM08-24 TaxID=2292352 RepID=UPI000E44EA96|nr:C-GCAxxG-C-C family protein [Eubacterium sp. OM08-24]RGM17940.1 C_GCAxxG_C_C family protein [Eubacterium sp. OM08-24]
MSKGDIAKQNFLNGYNCSQAVLLAFCEDFGLEKETALKISEPFGGGMGRMREVCGTVTGMFMVLGLAMGNSDAKDGSTKKNVYKSVQELAEKFKQDNGSIICRELLGIQKANKESYVPSERTTEYYKKRPCPELCKYAADILEEYLKEEDLI